MQRGKGWWGWVGGAVLLMGMAGVWGAAPTFTVATYNLENYLVQAVGTRPAKTGAGKAKIRESLVALRPDVLAVEEIGGVNALLDLQALLKAGGLDLPHWEHVSGWDTNIFVGVLSRYPIVGRRSHTNENYLLQGRRLQVSRGFAEVDIRVTPTYTFTLMAAHLKSRRQVGVASETEMREQEALILRRKVNEALARNPQANLVVVGDFNDVKDSKAVRTILGQGRGALVDTRPAEQNGDTDPHPTPRYEPRRITWTYHYGKEDTYDRIDYILVSSGMAREWEPEGTYVLNLGNWGTASDHRPIIARFRAENR